ncbi:MAG: hypothetical protein AB1Z98_15460 [Nannocystaceae bacterium]
MRTSSFFALAFSLCIPLSGCPGDDSGSDDTTTSTPTSTTDPTGSGEETVTPETEGMDETGTAPSGGFCLHQCEADGDCTVGGMDVGLTCQDNFCTGEAPDACADDDECIALFSGWSAGMACTAGGGECDALMQICLDVGGEGRCASGPSEFFMCETAGLDEIMTTDIDGNDVTVCGNASAQCGDNGVCFDPCTSDDDCLGEAAPVCNTGTGTCECGEDSHCETLGLPALSVCNGGTCGCGADENCVDGEAGDVCNDGLCGCSGDMACDGVDNAFDGGAISCVNL